MDRLSNILIVSAIIFTKSSQSACTQPISIPIHNVTLSNQQPVRGLQLALGTPPQDFSMLVTGDFNNTLLYDGDGSCDNATTAYCESDRGGIFDPSKSSTWALVGSQGPGEAIERNASSNLNGTDTLHLNSTTAFSKFPLGIYRNYGPIWQRNYLGMGRNSTFLKFLQSQRLVESQIWSLFWGWSGLTPSTQVDGSLILGGYDKSKLSGGNYTKPFQYSSLCPTSWMITFSDIQTKSADGTITSIMGSSRSRLTACIKPDVTLITLPGDVFQSFLTNAGGTNLGDARGMIQWGQLYDANDVYDGDLVFTLDNGVTITVPNHQLVGPEYFIADNGGIAINSTAREIYVYNIDDTPGKAMPLLGLPFLAASYLMVDNDVGQFTLWQSNATNVHEDVVSLGSQCQNNMPTRPLVSGTGITDAHEKHRQHTAIVVATIIGCIALICSVLGIYFCLRRTRRRKEATLDPVSQYKEGMAEMSGISAHGELQGSLIPAQELPIPIQIQELPDHNSFK